MRETRTAYRIVAGRNGIHVEFDDHFFNNEVVRRDGTTQVDVNVAALCQEIRTALYYIATADLAKH